MAKYEVRVQGRSRRWEKDEAGWGGETTPLGDDVAGSDALEAVGDGNLLARPHPAVELE